MYDKEKIYDDKISPLMHEIIKICKKEGIHMISSFYLKEETKKCKEMLCTTYLKSEEDGNNQLDTLKRCRKVIYKGYDVIPSFVAMTMTISD